MVKLERDADVEVPTKVINTNVYAMIAPMARNTLPFTVGISLMGYILIERTKNGIFQNPTFNLDILLKQ
jgi:hypothetical protein